MFRVLVVLTWLVLAAQGAYELQLRQTGVGVVLLAVSVLIAGLGAAADPYMREVERRRKERGG
jgi:type IV secretory pathway TrbD component